MKNMQKLKNIISRWTLTTYQRKAMKAICPKCNSTHLRKKGVIYSSGYETNMQRYVCHTCKKQFQVPKGSPKVDLPKILLFDIETALMEVYVGGLYKQFIPHTNIIKDENGWASLQRLSAVLSLFTWIVLS